MTSVPPAASPRPKNESGKAEEKLFSGHPPGVLLVSGTEMWERFSYFGLSALLVLFLVAPVASGGFAWDKAEAVRLYGLYSGLAFSAPAIGGWIASRYLGERRSIVIGGILITLGHALIGVTGLGPWLVEALFGLPAKQVIAGAAVPVGELFPGAEVWEALRVSALAGGHLELSAGRPMLPLYLAYLSKGWGLVLGLGFVIVGTAFLKGPISSIIGKLYEKGDSRREAGFTIFMMGIWAGALLAEFVVGVIGEHVGWHAGLAVAGLGMAGGLTNYLLKQNAVLGDVGKTAELRAVVEAGRPSFHLDRQERRRVGALAVMAVFTVIFSAAYNQYGGVWNLVVYENADRDVGGFKVPAAWFIAVTTLGFILLAPVALRVYRLLARRGYELDVVHKQALGLASIAIGYAILLVPSTQLDTDPQRLISSGWIVGAYVFFALGDVFIWPPQITAISRLAPERYQAFMIGLWYVTYGLGGIIAGYIAPLAYSWGLGLFTAAILAACATVSAVLLIIRPNLRRLMAA
ncbi:MAG: peptide MFS transporter [Sphingomonadales bacterium]|nr:peptide MFS transporter [Sphingomonadales bacterium]